MAEPVGEFSLESTGTTLRAGDDGFESIGNFEGTATGFGTVFGTLTFFADSAEASLGRARWVGQSFKADGSSVAGVGEGIWEESGHHRWSIKMDVDITDGSRIRVEGEVDLAGRSYKGKIFEG